MLFNSLHFALFFPLVLLAYFGLPHKWRWVLLLGASYYFYMCWKVEYAFLMLLSTFISYACALLMVRRRDKAYRKAILGAGLALNLGILFFFKYFDFLGGSANDLLRRFNILYEVPTLRVFLPVGISFYTFHAVSYLMDVYRGEAEPERHPGIYALYVSFFPQLVAGPISRPTVVLPQFRKVATVDYDRIKSGLLLMCWGFFQKVVIADRLAVAVNHVYNDPAGHSGLPLLAATYFFAFQIFCDFAGYTDIAIGALQVLGFAFPPNFRRPYFSASISEFWKRWHISLSTWFRDYLYIPLGGNRVGRARMYANLFLTFLVSGIWHGANWTFLIWGGLHGMYLIAGLWTQGIRERASRMLGLTRYPRLSRVLSVLATFHLVLFAWIFFRANSLSQAAYVLTHLFSRVNPPGNWDFGMEKIEILLAVCLIGVLLAVHAAQERGSLRAWLGSRPAWVRWGAYYAALMSIFLLGKFGQSQFIYFQF